MPKRTKSQSNAAEFKRPKRMGGLRKSKNADYYAPLQRAGKVADLPYDAPTLTLRQGILLSVGLLLFYGVICLVVIRAMGWGAAFLMLGGLLILLCAMGYVLWISQQRFWGEESADSSDGQDDDGPKPRSKSDKLPVVKRIQYESESDPALVIQPIQPRVEADLTGVELTDSSMVVPSAKAASKLASKPASKPAGQPDRAASKATSIAAQLKQHHKASTNCLKNDQLEEAIAHLQQALALQPKLAQTHEMLGRVYLKQENFPAAIAAFQQAIDCDATYASAYEGLGRGYFRTEQLAAAETAFQQAIQQDCRCFRAHEGWGKVLLKQGQIEVAIDQFQSALEINPNYPAAKKMLAEAQMRQRSRH